MKPGQPTPTELEALLESIELSVIKHLSNLYNYQDIAINISSLLIHPIICLPGRSNTNHLTVKQFLQIFVERWKNEIKYEEELMNLKNFIIEEYNEICERFKNKGSIQFIVNQQQQVINTICELIEIDKKQLAGEFCRGLLSGIEKEILTKINEYATYVLWKPFVASYPKGIIEFVKNKFQNNQNAASESMIENDTLDIIRFVQEYLRCNDIKTADFKSEKELNEFINHVVGERKVCRVLIDNVDKFQNVIQDQRKNIFSVKVLMKADKYTQKMIPFYYEELGLSNFSKKTNFQKIFDKFPKSIVGVDFDFKGSIDKIDLFNLNSFFNSILTKTSVNNFTLNFEDNDISNTIIQLLMSILEKTNGHNLFYISKFTYTSKKNEDLPLLAKILKCTQAITHLKLSFRGCSINDNEFKKLTASIEHLTNITFFFFDFAEGNNYVCDEGIIGLSSALEKMENLTEIILYFSGGNHSIGDLGIEKLANSLINKNKLKKLTLIICEGNNSISDKGMEKLSEAIKNLSSPFSLELFINYNGGNKGFTEIGRQFLINARTYELLKIDGQSINNQIPDFGNLVYITFNFYNIYNNNNNKNITPTILFN